jgi:acyl-CoA thioester hydrolase
MPSTHVRTFCIRHYECDAYGHVNHANYVRYMQEAAFDASAAVGYDLARYHVMDRLWLVRETDIEYLCPLRYGDSVTIKTWVLDFRRIRSRRAHEFRRAGSGELVAQASTDWVFLELSTGRPAGIPQEMMAAFFPEGPPPPAAPRDRFPAMTPPPTDGLSVGGGVFRHQRRVEWRDLDPAGHVNNATYLSYIEDCGLQAITAHGWPLARMKAEGFAMVARRHRVEHQKPALLDDALEILTWLSHISDTTADRHTLVTRPQDNALIARALTTHVCVSLETGKPIAIPNTFLAGGLRLAPAMAD